MFGIKLSSNETCIQAIVGADRAQMALHDRDNKLEFGMIDRVEMGMGGLF